MRRFDYSFLADEIPANIAGTSDIISDLRAKEGFRKLQYKDALNLIHTRHEDIDVTEETILSFHRYIQNEAVCKKKPFRVIWPGRYEDGKLYYAEEGYRDYKTYDVANYDVTVII